MNAWIYIQTILFLSNVSLAKEKTIKFSLTYVQYFTNFPWFKFLH